MHVAPSEYGLVRPRKRTAATPACLNSMDTTTARVTWTNRATAIRKVGLAKMMPLARVGEGFRTDGRPAAATWLPA